jgi:hypothetical protein
MCQVLALDALEFRVVVVRRILRPVQQYQLKRFEIHASLSQDTVQFYTGHVPFPTMVRCARMTARPAWPPRYGTT